MSTQPRSAVIVVSDEGLGGVIPLAKAIIDRDLEPVLVTGPPPEGPLERWRAYYDTIVILDDPYDVDTLVETARAIGAERPVAGLLSCYDGLVLLAAQAAAALGLAHPALDGLARARNKYATRIASHRAGLPTPRFALVSDLDGCEDAAGSVGFPAIAKPLNGTAGHLVRGVDSLAELEACYRDVLERLPMSFAGNYGQSLAVDGGGPGLDPRRSLLVEACMTGREYSAEVIVREGEIEHFLLLDKFLVDEESFFECGFTWPPLALSAEREEAIWRLIDGTLRALAVDHCTAHVEVMDTADGPFLIEVNAGRCGGQLIPVLLDRVPGVNIEDEILALTLGLEAPSRGPSRTEGRLTSFTVYPPGIGRVARVNGLDDLADLPGVVDVIASSQPGDVIASADHEYFSVNLLATCEGGKDELAELYRTACELVEFDLTPLTDMAVRS